MGNIGQIFEDIFNTAEEIRSTASNVNRHSVVRKEITEIGLETLNKLTGSNSILEHNFNEIYNNLNELMISISENTDEFKTNVDNFFMIIENIDIIKAKLSSLENEIDTLTAIVFEIKNDTDGIFMLALNASIVSSKYSHTSRIFDILANKLNEMSNFINQNLENIITVVQPITEGISKLIMENSQALNNIEIGDRNLIEFIDILEKQKKSTNELILRAYTSGEKINSQKDLIDELISRVTQMDIDADGAIKGSGSNKELGEMLCIEVKNVIEDYKSGLSLIDHVESINSKGSAIWDMAKIVNQKSMSQFDFSEKSVEFCDHLIVESGELKKTMESLNSQSANNNVMANSISENLGRLNSEISSIENKILESNETIAVFNENYAQIDSILEFLKNILKSMQIIGMYSRIESSRDPAEFEGFFTISMEINELQDKIQKNIPLIEKNINLTHELIEDVNNSFQKTSLIFNTIAESTMGIINKLQDIMVISVKSEKLTTAILGESENINKVLIELRGHLLQLVEIVKKPIDGSASNIERGKLIDRFCGEIRNFLLNESDQSVSKKTG